MLGKLTETLNPDLTLTHTYSELDSVKEDIEKLVSRPRSVRVVQTLSDPERITGFRERIQAYMMSSLVGPMWKVLGHLADVSKVDTNFDILRGVNNLESLLIAPSVPLEWVAL